MSSVFHSFPRSATNHSLGWKSCTPGYYWLTDWQMTRGSYENAEFDLVGVGVRGQSWYFVFLASSPMIQILVVQGPCFLREKAVYQLANVEMFGELLSRNVSCGRTIIKIYSPNMKKLLNLTSLLWSTLAMFIGLRVCVFKPRSSILWKKIHPPCDSTFCIYSVYLLNVQIV